MTIPAYPAYKDSGVQWVGRIPRHWDVLPFKTFVARIASGTSVNAEDRPASPDERGVLKTSCVYTGVFNPDENKAILRHEYDRASCSLQAGALIVSRMNTPELIGSAGLVVQDRPNIFLPDRLWQVTLKGCSAQFAYYWTRSSTYRAMIEAVCDGTSSSMKNLSQSSFLTIPFLRPPIGDQTAIAAFLDRETAKIDALVAEQERLIALLQEKRQAVISQAVTKGLNPEVPMKDSGVEWLGKVPDHWEARKLSSIISKITNGYVGPTRDILVDAGVPYLQSLHIKSNKITFGEDYFVTAEWSQQHAKSILMAGDVLVVQTGDIGQAAVVTPEYEGCNCHALIVISPVASALSGPWLAWVFNSDYGRQTLLSIQTGALHPHLNCGDVRDLYIPMPPLSEQGAIVQFVSDKTTQFDELIGEAAIGIALLKERRSALISAAVTGKIDVRSLSSMEEVAA